MSTVKLSKVLSELPSKDSVADNDNFVLSSYQKLPASQLATAEQLSAAKQTAADGLTTLKSALKGIANTDCARVVITESGNYAVTTNLDALNDLSAAGLYAITNARDYVYGHMLIGSDPMLHGTVQWLFGNWNVEDGKLMVSHSDGCVTIVYRVYPRSDKQWSDWKYYQQNFIKEADDSLQGGEWTYNHTAVDAIKTSLQTAIDSINTDKQKLWATLQDVDERDRDAIDKLDAAVATNTTDIATNAADIAANKANIATNTANIATLNTRVLELGNFATENEALAAIKDTTVSGNKDIIFAHLTYQNAYSITLVQCVENNYCRQIIFNKTRIFQRAIYFTDGTRKTISNAEDWAFLLADRLKWDSSANKYVLNQFENNFNAGVTDAIPLASSSNDGLMSSANRNTLEYAKNKIRLLREKSTTKVVVRKCIPPFARANMRYYFSDGKIRHSYNRKYFKSHTLTLDYGYEYRLPTKDSTLHDELKAAGVKKIDLTVFAKYVESKGYDSIIVVQDSGFGSCVARVLSNGGGEYVGSVSACEQCNGIPFSSRYRIIGGEVVRRARDIYPRSGRYTTAEMEQLFVTYHFRFKAKRRKYVRGQNGWTIVKFGNVLRRSREVYPVDNGASYLWHVRRDKYSPYVQYVLTMVSESEPCYKLTRV